MAEGLGLTVDNVCRELYRASDAVDADLLGACLGHHHEFCQSLCRTFARHFEERFSGLDVVTALRDYLWRFRLPGEAAPIGRVLEGFAAGYFAANPPAIAHASTGHSTEPTARGWYVHQPTTDKPACIACGGLARADAALRTCTGCGVVSFCPRCARIAGRQGHAIRACIGFGRACEAAARHNGRLNKGHITYASPVARGGAESAYVGDEDKGNWVRAASPIKSQDAVFILSYAIVMLSTNLHNPSVKKSDKMQLHQFLQQLREQNDGAPFPGDYLESIYKDIKGEELKVMTV